MSTVTFNDIYQTKVSVGISGSGYIRIDLEENSDREKVTGGPEPTPVCISMNEHQAQILASALNLLLESER